jgi:hypothetical protein
MAILLNLVNVAGSTFTENPYRSLKKSGKEANAVG